MTDDELVAYVDFEVSEYARRMATHVYDDEQAFQAQKEAFPRATGGCCLLHHHDYHLLPILCLSRFLLTHSSFALRRTTTFPRLAALLQQHAPVLECVLSNALHSLYFSHYIHSLGTIRFNRVQEFFMYFFYLYASTVDYTDLFLFAVQLCLRLLDPDRVYRHCLAFFTRGLKEGLHDTNDAAPKGKETMVTYFFFCLLSVVYDRSVVSFDKDAIFARRVINYACRPENQTLEGIESAMQNYQRMDEEVYKVLQTVADEQFDMDEAANVYQLKDAVVAQACVFNGYGSLFNQNEMMEVAVRQCSDA